jgi:hypothetical protein
MKTISYVLAGLLLSSAFAVDAAQLYRWVDEKGNVEWRDTPPPANAKKVEQRSVGGGTTQTPQLPYTVQQAMKSFPITLWISSCGDGCDKARAHLARRGIPYTPKDPATEFESFKKQTGGSEVPVIFIGSTRLRGYNESDWDNALDTAGYPRSPSPGYKPPPTPAAPTKPAAVPPPAPTTP